MAWGTEFHTDIFISRQSFQTVYELDERINEIEQDIQNRNSRIKMFAAATPNNIIPPDGPDPLHYIEVNMDEELAMLEEDIRELYQLSLFKEHLQETGKDPSEFTE